MFSLNICNGVRPVYGVEVTAVDINQKAIWVKGSKYSPDLGQWVDCPLGLRVGPFAEPKLSKINVGDTILVKIMFDEGSLNTGTAEEIAIKGETIITYSQKNNKKFVSFQRVNGVKVYNKPDGTGKMSIQFSFKNPINAKDVKWLLWGSKAQNRVLPLIDEKFAIVDLPGYGFAQAGQKQRDALKRMIERYCLLREQLISLFVLVDCRLEPQKIDIDFMNFLGENEIPFAIVFTKADKVGKGRLSENIASYKLKLQETWEELPPIFLTSAEKGDGRDELINYIEGINENLKS